MSYYPTIVIKKADLVKKSTRITAGLTSRSERKRQAYEKLEEAFDEKKSHHVSFPEIDLIIINVELTASNKAVRDVLDELGITYRTFW